MANKITFNQNSTDNHHYKLIKSNPIDFNLFEEDM